MKIWGMILVFALPLATLGQAYYTPYTFVTLAGLAGSSGNNDGVGSAARFNNPNGVAADTNGNVYLADTYNNAIRKITASGVVTTLAETVGQVGDPEGVAVDSSGNIYVADSIDNTILKVTPLDSVSTLAGLAYPFGGFADGKGTNALFNMPVGVAVDSSGNVYVADQSNNRIRKITPDGTVSTLAGAVRGYADGVGSAAKFNLPRGVAVDTNGNVYVAEYFGQIIRQITPSGVASTIAGLGSTDFIPVGGYADGTNQAAKFNFPASVAVDKNGSLYVADNNNSAIRKITHVGTNWIVATIAGLAGNPGSSDGTGSTARFNGPFGIAVDNDGYVYVADAYNDTIRVGWAGTASVSLRIQPTNQVVQAAANTTFNVVAYGQQPLNYHWLFNGNPISGANSATLILNSVTAGNDGDYSVVVSNPHCSVTSTSASLAVLDDGANGNTPTQMSVPAAPPQPSGVNSLVLITHGWEPLGPLADVSWITDMANAIQAKAPGWTVMPFNWIGAAWFPDPDLTLISGAALGTLYAKLRLEPQHWQRIHFIAHSAGSAVIEAMAKELKSSPNPPEIQETFLDPYTGYNLTGREIYGINADWADDYFVVDYETDFLPVAGGWASGSTSGQLEWAYNVDVGGTFQATFIPFFVGSGVAGSTSAYVATTPSLSHGSPIDFYMSTINGTADSCAAGYGWPLSMEAGGSGTWASHPLNNSPLPLCTTASLSQNRQPIRSDSPLNFSIIPNGTSGSGVNFTGNSGVSLSSSFASQANVESGGIRPLGQTSSNSPAWLAMGVSVTNAINFVQFDAAFTDTNSAQGLLTVYWNTNQIGLVDERVAGTSLQSYHFQLPGVVANGLYTLSFRLDSFDNSSSIAVTNVTTGFVGLTQPISLSFAFTNGAPLLQLSAATNFIYLIQSSTNLIDWTPTALLLNTNGTVQFQDSALTNANARFYRAMLQ
jgi:NHL repeat/Immunoglobulin domain